MAAAELFDSKRLISSRDIVIAQIGDQLRPVELFFLANFAEFREGLI